MKRPRERTEHQRQRFFRDKEAADNRPAVQVLTPFTGNINYTFLLDISSPTDLEASGNLLPILSLRLHFSLHSAAPCVSSYSVKTLLDLSLYSVHIEKLNRGQ